MSKFNLGLLILAVIGVVGLIVLSALDKSVDILLPLVTAIIGAVLGVNKEGIGRGVAGFWKR